MASGRGRTARPQTAEKFPLRLYRHSDSIGVYVIRFRNIFRAYRCVAIIVAVDAAAIRYVVTVAENEPRCATELTFNYCGLEV